MNNRTVSINEHVTVDSYQIIDDAELIDETVHVDIIDALISNGGGSGLIDHIEVEGVEQPNIDKTVNITRQAIFASNNNVSQFTNNGDGTSPYTTASEVSEALLNKQDKLTAGDNITIEDNVISTQVPIAAKEYPGTVYAWTDADGFHLWINDPSRITYDTEENSAGGLTYNIYTLDYTVEANAYGETYIIGE